MIEKRQAPKANRRGMQFKTHIIFAVMILCVIILGYVDQKLMETPYEASQSLEDTANNVRKVDFSQVPNASFIGLDGKEFDLVSLRGKLVIVHFWATWCAPCIKEFPELLKMLSLLEGEVVLVAVANDADEAVVERFLLKVDGEQYLRHDNLYVVMDKDRLISQRTFESYKLPETIIVDRQGKMVQKIIGGETHWSSDDMLDYLRGL